MSNNGPVKAHKVDDFLPSLTGLPYGVVPLAQCECDCHLSSSGAVFSEGESLCCIPTWSTEYRPIQNQTGT